MLPGLLLSLNESTKTSGLQVSTPQMSRHNGATETPSGKEGRVEDDHRPLGATGTTHRCREVGEKVGMYQERSVEEDEVENVLSTEPKSRVNQLGPTRRIESM